MARRTKSENLIGGNHSRTNSEFDSFVGFLLGGSGNHKGIKRNILGGKEVTFKEFIQSIVDEFIEEYGPLREEEGE